MRAKIMGFLIFQTAAWKALLDSKAVAKELHQMIHEMEAEDLWNALKRARNIRRHPESTS